jgi:hypothetical protein
MGGDEETLGLGDWKTGGLGDWGTGRTGAEGLKIYNSVCTILYVRFLATPHALCHTPSTKQINESTFKKF